MYPTQKRNKKLLYSAILVLLTAIVFTPAILLINYGDPQHKHLISVSLIFMMIGLIYEGFKIVKNWFGLFLTILGACVGSYFAFIPWKRESPYDFEMHFQIWPFLFIVIFSLIIIGFFRKEVKTQVHEGITLLQSVALIYLVIDTKMFGLSFIPLILISIPCLYFIYFTCYNAFTYSPLLRRPRLILSLWSSLIMVVFAIDNVIDLLTIDSLESLSEIPTMIYIAVRYFLLGISTIYIIQNVIMLFNYFPDKKTKLSTTVKKTNETFIERFSAEQTNISVSICLVLIPGILFLANNLLELISRQAAIWIVFAVFPLLLKFLKLSFKNERFNHNF